MSLSLLKVPLTSCGPPSEGETEVIMTEIAKKEAFVRLLGVRALR